MVFQIQRDLGQQLITGLGRIRVVNRFEPVDIQKHQAQVLLRVLTQPILNTGAVQEASQVIVF